MLTPRKIYRHVYQRVLVEPSEEVRDVAEQAWNRLVCNSGLVELLHAACPCMTTWLCLSMQPVRAAFDPALLVHARSQRKRSGGIEGINSFDQSVVQPKCFIGGESIYEHVNYMK